MHESNAERASQQTCGLHVSATSCGEQKHAGRTHAQGCLVMLHVMLHTHEVIRPVWLLAVVTLGWILWRGRHRLLVLHILPQYCCLLDPLTLVDHAYSAKAWLV